MPLPDDPLKRWWIELADANPELRNSLRPALGTIVAYDRDHVATIAGTAFIVAAEPQFALALTAKHVLEEGVLRGQRPRRRHVPSALFVHRDRVTPSLEPTDFKVFVMGSEHALALNASFASYNEDSDLASLLLMPQSDEEITERVSIPLDLDDPPLGAVVHLVSQDGLNVGELVPPRSLDGDGQKLTFFRRLSIRRGVVTGTYPRGHRQYRWPCFTTSIPASPGMSGGFVFWPRDGVTIAACGVVCADNSSVESYSSFAECGESIIGSTWPGLALRIPFAAPHKAEEPTLSVFEAIRTGRLPLPLGRFARMRYVEGPEGGLLFRDP